MGSITSAIYYGDEIGKTVFDPPYSPAEERVLLHLRDLGKDTIGELEWEVFAFVTEEKEEAFRQGVRLGAHLAYELMAEGPED